ncbi:hypothetical protein KDA_52810 [Dictyobacter alpinus]|uniref:Uncharacterized protein n=1 Tax=Dictyobacter alpinus TaxID=2014873 RepID=A0A402BEV8_9CHLR|nr:hypothetical protein KDA_52810 [Dictyobacter alpinus]
MINFNKELVIIVLLIICIPVEIYAAFTTPTFWSLLVAVLIPIVTIQSIMKYIQQNRLY